MFKNELNFHQVLYMDFQILPLIIQIYLRDTYLAIEHVSMEEYH